ncbi:MAG TPA: HD domain-containing phosphohydrolase [Limnochordales bacterium]
MRRVDIRTIPEGALLARPLVDQRGVVVLAAGKSVSETMRERLWERGFRHAYVEAPGFEGLKVREPLEDHTYQTVRHLLVDVVAALRRGADPSEVRLPVPALLEATSAACEDLARQQQQPEGFLLYPPWGTLADRFVTDSINVAVVAARVGFAVLGEEGARHLFLAGLLQDLGRWLDDRPSEHVAVSLAMVRGIREISAWVKHIIADHHERLDGSGYPQGKRAEALHPLSRVMAVAVAYLELIMKPRRPTLPHEAQEHLMAEAGTLFDWEAVQALRRVLPGYPVGTVVRLSTRRIGVVVHPGPASLNRPRVRLLGRAADREVRLPEPAEETEGADEAVGQVPMELEEGAGAGPPAPGKPVSYEEVDLAADHAVAIVEVLDR